MIRVYISGPITNMPGLNRAAFRSAAAYLRGMGYEAVNPFDVCKNPATWKDAMRADIAELVRCDVIALLPGWKDSRGARLEKHIADEVGIHPMVITQPQLDGAPEPHGMRMRIKQWLCAHRYDIADLNRDPDGMVSCACHKCDKVNRAACGLYLPGSFDRYTTAAKREQ
jgi:hypothetical protein